MASRTAQGKRLGKTCVGGRVKIPRNHLGPAQFGPRGFGKNGLKIKGTAMDFIRYVIGKPLNPNRPLDRFERRLVAMGAQPVRPARPLRLSARQNSKFGREGQAA